jgi:DGQHR domain-containing protein
MPVKTKRPARRSNKSQTLRLPALEFKQGKRRLYTFAVEGKDLHKFATISRINRQNGHSVAGYQRPEVLSHISEIRGYLESENPILPNALVVAFDKRVKFQSATKSRGACSQTGVLEIPLDEWEDETQKPGWIVDGQQRAAALRDAQINGFPICVVGFIAENTEEQRQQFILVNATKPLPKGLIYELLPSTNGKLPTALQKRRYPAEISERLNFDEDSPLKGMIRTPTNGDGIIADNSILKMVENSLSDGVLYRYTSINEQLTIMKNFWKAVHLVFPKCWNLPPRKSRLMHGAGIVAMGFLMDTIADRHRHNDELSISVFQNDLKPLAEICRWTEGYWDFGPGTQMKWNEVQNVPRHIQLLANYLLVRYKELVWNG